MPVSCLQIRLKGAPPSPPVPSPARWAEGGREAGHPALVLGASQERNHAGQCCPGLGSIPHHPLDRCPLRAEHVPEHESPPPERLWSVPVQAGGRVWGRRWAGKFTAARQPPPLEAQAESPREGLPCCHITLNSPLRLRLWEVWDWQGKLGAGRLALSHVGGVCVCACVCPTLPLPGHQPGGSWAGQAEWGQGQRCSDLCE